MMEFGTYKMIEFIMLFGLCFVIGFWQLRSVNKAIAERKARDGTARQDQEPVTKNVSASETATSA